MQRIHRQIVALAATAAWILQAWLGATHVHPHDDSSCAHASASSVCHTHAHDHAHTHHGHGHSHAPTVPPSDDHESSDCQICRLLAEQPLPFAAPVELTGTASVPDRIISAATVPILRPERLFQSRAPPTLAV